MEEQGGQEHERELPDGRRRPRRSGVAGVVKSTGALTYVDAAYSIQNKFQFALIRNRAGGFATPGVRGVTAALSQLPNRVTNLAQLKIVDPPRSAGRLAYPISTFTYVIVPTRSGDKAADYPSSSTGPSPPARGSGRRCVLRAPAGDGEGRVPRDQEDPGLDVRLARLGLDELDVVRPAAPEADLRRRGLRLGDVAFKGVAVAASAAAAVLLGLIAYKVFDLAWPAIKEFELSFVWTDAWNPVTNEYGALAFVCRTVVTSLIALTLAVPLSIAIALFLTEIAPRRVAAPIATMVELLAAIPGVVLGL